ncbi:uncharacterized protein KY384_009233 [Bacidia gigantensis]|uniref:uncharacterized protein n=1 Tax=Bacidia gigantensis TaxID=2732470 RepID=UPI001D048A76|nr:uncharacterized protein KY384_009233 [Bacidia gigantensis]KAG8525589.1 hypothetical protein KY384_009233 [Bacidia gigantensis]
MFSPHGLSRIGIALFFSQCAIGVEGTTPAIPRAQKDSAIIDLGYALYRPTSFNETGQYYNFSNIRYAAPPLGDLRFADPQPPLQEDRHKVNDGSVGFTCPQAIPAWAVSNTTTNTGSPVTTGLSGEAESEDCLFLDVIVPAKVFQNREPSGKKLAKRWDLAPVLFNIFGGGFYSGDKAGFYKPQGLLERSQDSFVYVSINYRLGAFGFLSNLEKSQGNTTSPNAGFLDQRLALKWVQKNIHLFGGDPSQVTIIGESAGGSSVVYHTVAYGGSKPDENKLFKQIISQSAGVEPVYPEQASIGANLFLQTAGVTSVDEARKLPTEKLQEANKKANAAIPFLVMSFAPGVDGDIIPDLPLRLMNAGKFNKELNVIAANNNRETGVSVGTSTTTDAAIKTYLDTNLPAASQEIKDYIFNVLYPPLPQTDLPYTTNSERLQLMRKEQTLSCGSYHIAKAFENKTHNYIFSIPPAIHAQDLAYTYYPTNPTIGFYPERAVQLQQYLVNFVGKGDPAAAGQTEWPIWGDQANAVNITVEGITQVQDDQSNPRCAWWNQALYRPATIATTADNAQRRRRSRISS